MRDDRTGGGSENSKHQKLATYSQETCAELVRKWQEEGFVGGLPARNMPGIRTTACHACGIVVSRAQPVDNVVDNVVDNYRTYPQGPQTRANGPWRVFSERGYPTLFPPPIVNCGAIVARSRALPTARKHPANDRRRKTPGVSTRGLIV